MSDQSEKFFPHPTADTKPYWDGCKKHEVFIQYCSLCDKYQFYPRPICTNCMDDNVEWKKASGMGSVISYTTVRRSLSKAYEDEEPYILAIIELDEGVTMLSNIIGCSTEEVKAGMRVEVVFEEWSNDISIPKFCPV
ncbi:Zn-ribbon domain-containing OB-fold protein [Oceanobacillus senegalensis]|uniref:Zn-ribbon domain-containing OB-fold protein n=1 Tax=Oceanobacillus senegalensis TaxID=1936063 RepID=UPI000A30DC0D|nr:Zn-ribbon domain-containing OB-fold protein [Oceanobacillus senegalensis]